MNLWLPYEYSESENTARTSATEPREEGLYASDARSGNTLRYELFGSMYAQALREVGVDARMGEMSLCQI